jgi:hypothetical protein
MNEGGSNINDGYLRDLVLIIADFSGIFQNIDFSPLTNISKNIFFTLLYT